MRRRCGRDPVGGTIANVNGLPIPGKRARCSMSRNVIRWPLTVISERVAGGEVAAPHGQVGREDGRDRVGLRAEVDAGGIDQERGRPGRDRPRFPPSRPRTTAGPPRRGTSLPAGSAAGWNAAEVSIQPGADRLDARDGGRIQRRRQRADADLLEPVVGADRLVRGDGLAAIQARGDHRRERPERGGEHEDEQRQVRRRRMAADRPQARAPPRSPRRPAASQPRARIGSG